MDTCSLIGSWVSIPFVLQNLRLLVYSATRLFAGCSLLYMHSFTAFRSCTSRLVDTTRQNMCTLENLYVALISV